MVGYIKWGFMEICCEYEVIDIFVRNYIILRKRVSFPCGTNFIDQVKNLKESCQNPRNGPEIQNEVHQYTVLKYILR